MRITSLVSLGIVALATGQSVGPTLQITYSPSPFPLNGVNARYTKDVAYDTGVRRTFDAWLPVSGTPTAAVLFLHAGGFINGDKGDAWNNEVKKENIRNFLRNNIAFFTADYQYMTDNVQNGLYTSLYDIRRCLQFIRYYSTTFNIQKAKFGAYGNSAGGGASIWLGFHPNMAVSGASELLQRESTRLVAVGHSTSQATYDPDTLDRLFKATGINNYFQMDKVPEQIFLAYHITSLDKLYTDQRVIAMRKDVDMLALMSADDPEFYTETDNPIITPTDTNGANHVPLHEKALDERANRLGLGHKANIPAYGIDSTGGETLVQFMIRKLKA